MGSTLLGLNPKPNNFYGNNMKQNDSIGEYVNIETLQENPKNPRANELAVDKIARSIERFGFAAPIVARKNNGMIIAGHTRYKAAKKLGLQNIPVRWVNLNEKDSELYMIADNKLSEIAGWDYSILQDIINQNIEDGIDLTDIGFTEEELSAYNYNNIEFGVSNDSKSTNEEWVNMPEYFIEDKTSYKKLIVNFENEEDFVSFQTAINQTLTDKTRHIWYPHQERKQQETKRY